MADLAKLKRNRTLGTPPGITEASTNLQAPESAPATPPLTVEPVRETSSSRPPQASSRRSYDGRSARRTGRTVQFATRVSPEFDERLRLVAEREGLLLVEVLERALDAYEGHPR